MEYRPFITRRSQLSKLSSEMKCTYHSFGNHCSSMPTLDDHEILQLPMLPGDPSQNDHFDIENIGKPWQTHRLLHDLRCGSTTEAALFCSDAETASIRACHPCCAGDMPTPWHELLLSAVSTWGAMDYTPPWYQFSIGTTYFNPFTNS